MDRETQPGFTFAARKKHMLSLVVRLGSGETGRSERMEHLTLVDLGFEFPTETKTQVAAGYMSE